MTENILFYTKEEVSELLGVAESTVYSLAKNEQIVSEVLPKGVSRPKRYTKESVDIYKDSKQTEPIGFAISDLAEKYKVSNQRIYQLIKKLNLKTSRAVIGKRNKLIVSETDIVLIEKELTKKIHKGTKTDFYKHQEDIALFQLFNTASNEKYRITRTQSNEWGIHLATTNHFIPFKEAVEQLQLTSAYSIHKKPIQTAMFVNFTFKSTDLMAYEFIDACYSHLGIENMHLLFTDSELKLAIKAYNQFLSVCNLPVEYLNVHCENAVIELVNDEYEFVLSDKPLTVVLNGDSYDALKKYAEEMQKSFSSIVNELIQNHLK